MFEAALADLTVIDLTHYVAGPFCTKLLADFGADVLKIERPGIGDGARRLGPFPDDMPDIEKSAIFLHLNANKRGMTLNLKSPQGVDILKRLVADADILVESFEPRVMPSLGLSYDTLERVNPRLVMVSVSNFGQTGPYRDYKGSEIVDYAIGGPFYVTGQKDRPPLKLGGNAVQYLGGIHAAGATVVAVFGAEARGYGDHVDVSIMETQAGSPDRRTPMLMGSQFTKEVFHRGATGNPPIRPCKDGYVNILSGARTMRKVWPMLGRPDLADDPRYVDPKRAVEPQQIEEFDAAMLSWVMERTMAEAWDAAQKNRFASGPIYTASDILADPNFQERGYWEELDHPVVGKLRYSGLPFRTPGEPRHPRLPPPLLGQHTDEALGGLGYDAAAIARLRREGVV